MAAPGGLLSPPSWDPRPKLLPHGFSYLGWARQAIGGEPRVVGDLETSLSGERSSTRSAGLDSPAPSSLAGELPPLLLTWGRCHPRPGASPPAPREPEPCAGAGEPGSPYLSESPAPRSWGPCGWSAFSPGRSAAWFLGVQVPLANPQKAGPQRRGRCGQGQIISIARRLGQSARGAAGAGRGGTPGPGFGATPRTGARAWGQERVAGVSCPRDLPGARRESRRPLGPDAPTSRRLKGGGQGWVEAQPAPCTGSGTLRGTQPGRALTPAR